MTTKKKKNVSLRVICMFGQYGIYKVLLDDEEEVESIGDNILAKEYPSYSAMLADVAGITSSVNRSVITVNSGNKSLYGVR